MTSRSRRSSHPVTISSHHRNTAGSITSASLPHGPEQRAGTVDPVVEHYALDARATDINEPMKLAAARAIAESISAEELNEEYIVPGIFNKQVTRRVARAVETAARNSGVARRGRH
jgi:hypothetical protein